VTALVWFSVGKNVRVIERKNHSIIAFAGEAEELILSYYLHTEKCPDTGLRQNRIN